MTPQTYQRLVDVCDQIAALSGTIRNEMNDILGGGDHIELIRHFNNTRGALERIKMSREALQQMADDMSYVRIPDAMRIAGVKTITIEDVGRVTISHRYSCSMIDKEAGFKWLRDTGNGGIIQETVNSSTLGAFAKNVVEEEGKELPDDIFKVSITATTSITKAK